jgi:hypothetical protein
MRPDRIFCVLKVENVSLQDYMDMLNITKFSLPGVSIRILCVHNTRAVLKVCGLTLLLRVGTLWRCDDGLFFEVPPLASYALLTTLHPLLENVLQTVDQFENSCLGAPFLWLEKPRNRMGRDLN